MTHDIEALVGIGREELCDRRKGRAGLVEKFSAVKAEYDAVQDHAPEFGKIRADGFRSDGEEPGFDRFNLYNVDQRADKVFAVLLDSKHDIGGSRCAFLPCHDGSGAAGCRGACEHGPDFAWLGHGIGLVGHLEPLSRANASSLAVGRESLAKNLEFPGCERVEIVRIDFRIGPVLSVIGKEGARHPAVGPDPVIDMAIARHRPHGDLVGRVILYLLPADILSGIAFEHRVFLDALNILRHGRCDCHERSAGQQAFQAKCHHVLPMMIWNKTQKHDDWQAFASSHRKLHTALVT